MHAQSPDELPEIFRRCFNAGDVDGLMASYYAPDATYAPLPGQIVSGDDEVRAAISSLVDLGHPMSVTLRHALRAGDTALLIVDWEIPAIGLTGTATDVARVQADGTWRCVIDNPHGGVREVPGIPSL
jgi:ketosteroid isomerase-like protein